MSRLVQPTPRVSLSSEGPSSAPSSSSLHHQNAPDQKKIYMDWANHYLRKGHYTHTLSDLHDCVKGDNLPIIIHAVVQSHVPNITVSPATEDERTHNIKCCIRHLEATGINCSSLTVSDLTDGNTKAILSLFYNLSQFKRTSKPAIGTTEAPGSKIARPVSPGLRNTHGVAGGSGASVPTQQQALTNGIGGISKMAHSVSPSGRRTAGSSIGTSTIDKPFAARRTTPYKNVVLNGEKPAALDGSSEEGNKVAASLPATVSTSRLDHMTRKNSIPGVRSGPVSSSQPSNGEHGLPMSISQPNLHRQIPSRSKSDPRLLHPRTQQQQQRKDSNSSDIETESAVKSPSSGLPKRMLKQPSMSGIPSGRSTPVETRGISSGRNTPSRLTRPGNRLNKLGTGSEKKAGDSTTKEVSSDEGEGERGRIRARSNSEVRRVSVTTPPARSSSRTGNQGIPVASSSRGSGIPPGSLNLLGGGRGLQKSAIHSSDSRLASPSSVPHGDISAGLRKLNLTAGKERSFSSSEPGTPLGDVTLKKAAGSGLQAPSPRQPRGQSSSGIQVNVKKSESTIDERQGAKKEGGGEEERTSSKISKPSSLPRFGATSPGDRRKSPSGLHKLQQPLATSQGFIIPPGGLGSKVTQGNTSEGPKFEMTPRERVGGSNSSVEESFEEGRPAVLEKQVSSTSSTGSSTVVVGDSKKLVEPSSLPVKQLAGGKDNRRISPEGMSPDRKTLSNESIEENKKNSLEKQEKTTKTKLITETESGDGVNVNGTRTDKVGVVEVGGASEMQTPNLSQGSEVATDTTLSSLSLASISSPPPPSQPETGQPPYSISASPLTKRSSSPSQLSHDSHMTSDNKPVGTGDQSGVSRSSPARYNALRSPLATKDKEKAKRARSLSPKFSRRIFPPPTGPSVNISQYDGSRSGPFSPPHSASERFAHLDLSRTDSPESVKSDVAVAAYSSSRKPLRSSLRTTKEKDSSSSSLDSGKVHFHLNKVTISPRSSRVVYDPNDVGLHTSATFTPPTILSPAKRVRGRPSSLSDNTSLEVEHGKRESTTSERMDYSTVEQFEQFLKPSLGQSPSHLRYDSTPELLQTYENELSTMKKDLENKDRMLSMYENSMADLSSKVHHLKKSLEEKDQEIKHLNDVKQSLFDFDGRSLASRMSAAGTEVLSDGCLSDSAMEPSRHDGKGDEKKKKKWKRWSFRRKTKDTHDISSSLDTESMISGKSGRSYSGLRRHPSKSKTDLMSISEHSPDMRLRDSDGKSVMSEFVPGMMLYSNEDIITVCEDASPGAKAPVTLLPGYASPFPGYGSVREEEEGEGTVVLGTVSIAPEISWITMDTKICDIFMHHINSVDVEGNLGLNEDSILHYFVADQRREIGNALLPPLTPYQSLATGTTVRIVLRGALQESCDSLAYKILINTETVHSYISLLMEMQWLVVMGTKGTCKTSLVQGLSRHLSQIVGDEEEEEEEGGGEVVIINYNVEKDGLEKVLIDMRENLSRKIRMWPHPPIIVIDNIYECSVLEQILSVASNLSRRPYIIATLCTATMQGIPLHQLLFHHRVRVVTCHPQMEPVFGILSRSLRKQVYKLKAARIEVEPVVEKLLQWLPYLLEHLDGFINRFHTQTVSLGPRVFMDCGVDQNRNELESWFINLWNHFVIPYLMGAIMAGIETYTADPLLEWVDVREFVVETYPWQPSVNIMKLQTLTPEDVGWNHAIRPQQNRFLHFKDDMKLPDDTRSMTSRLKPE